MGEGKRRDAMLDELGVWLEGEREEEIREPTYRDVQKNAAFGKHCTLFQRSLCVHKHLIGFKSACTCSLNQWFSSSGGSQVYSRREEQGNMMLDANNKLI